MNEPDTPESEDSVMRNRHLENFAVWMLRSGLDPQQYGLVEESRPDGGRLWYFRLRAEDDGIIAASDRPH
jgi:hypothetical protein